MHHPDPPQNTAVLEEMARKEEAWEEEKRAMMRTMAELKAVADEKARMAMPHATYDTRSTYE